MSLYRKIITLHESLKSLKGFTLLELIVVLTLLSILSGMAVVKYSDLQVGAKNTAVKRAVDELNGQVRQVFKNNKLDDASTGPYQGYSGDLGPEVIITGQAPNIPGSGTIKMASDSKTYQLIWNPGPDNSKAAGHFKLGDML